MENTPYNRKIQEQVDSITRRYLSHLDSTGKQVLEDNQAIPAQTPNTEYEGSGLLGSIFPPAQLFGLGKKGRPKKEKPKKEGGIIKTEPKKGRGRPKKNAGAKSVGSNSKPIVSGNVEKVGGIKLGRAVGSGKAEMEGAGFFDSLGSIASSVAPLALMALGKPKKGRPPKKAGSVGVDAMAQQKNLLTGNGKKKGRKAKMEGGGWFDDVVSSVGNVVKTAADVAPSALALAKMVKGRGKAKEGGAKKASSWIDHVKAYAKKHKMKYEDCLKDPKCKSSYKK